MNEMEIISWNINGYNTVDQYGGLSALLAENPEFICMQETKVSDPELLYTLSTYKYYHYYNFGIHKGHNGVYVYARQSAETVLYEIGLDRFDMEGRFLCLKYVDYYLVIVYMPHGGRDKKDLNYKLKAYDYLTDFLQTIKDESVIICGDFNIAVSAMDVERDKNNADNIMFTSEEKEKLSKIFALGYEDVYRFLYPLKEEYTWWPYAFKARKRNIGWRIDYFLVSERMKRNVLNTKIEGDILGSDHCPIKLWVKTMR